MKLFNKPTHEYPRHTVWGKLSIRPARLCLKNTSIIIFSMTF